MERRKSTRIIKKVPNKYENYVQEPPPKKQKVVKKLDEKPVLKPKAEQITPGPGPGYVSAYEASIQKNIEERMQLLKMLKIDAIKEEVKATTPGAKQKVAKQFKRTPKPVTDPTPSRRSLRLSGRDPTGVELPPRPVSPAAEPTPRKLGTESVQSANTGLSEPEQAALHLSDISRQLAQQERPERPVSGEAFAAALTDLAVTDDTWTKVTPLRVVSMAFCPLRQKHVLAAGDKRGVLGLWDVSRGEQGVHNFAAHTGHIVGVSFAPADGRRCFTSSYDGLCRALDLERQQFDEVYATPDPDLYLNHHTHCGEHVLLMGRSDGQLLRRDLREPGLSTLRLSDRGGLRFLSAHPSREHCLAVVERPSTVALWDLRHVKGPRSALQRVTLPRACASAVISRRSGDLLVAPCSDDTFRVYDGVNRGSLDATKTIRHNNQTGRWLTSFKPTWLPGSDQLFLVGSLLQPRRMEVYDRDGRVHHLLMSQELQAVCSTIVCHPSEPAVAGANSSGKVYLFQ